jgi:tetratricopeptide (TPR) repeat protein
MILHQNHQQQLSGNKLILILTILILSQSTIFAQRLDFEKGVNFFNEGKYSEAIKILEKFILKESEYSETSNLLLALSYFKINNFEKAKQLIQRFEIVTLLQDQFP